MDKLTARATVVDQFAHGKPFPVTEPRLQLSELPLHGIIRVQGDAKDPAFQAALRTALCMELPASERVSAMREARLAWAGPNEWLYFCSLSTEKETLVTLKQTLADQFATVTHISDSRVSFIVTGPDAPNFLSKGCGIDLYSTSFEPGKVVTTRFAGLPAMLMRRSGDVYVIYFDVASAGYVLDWMLDAVDEFRA
ncbi:sarcosine oxidase subunit gamma [Caballeronia sordidicola]|uniref:sarcosine oxidase subunit gamma n=1 Tax=Caballeronia sordidicola TaxID=196367 RepID=UPI00094C3B0D|nr:sarcosine oxidase subunit gamma family protein [Caballeronia sordidicola]